MSVGGTFNIDLLYFDRTSSSMIDIRLSYVNLVPLGLYVSRQGTGRVGSMSPDSLPPISILGLNFSAQP